MSTIINIKYLYKIVQWCLVIEIFAVRINVEAY
jgi:hypothetical protein